MSQANTSNDPFAHIVAMLRAAPGAGLRRGVVLLPAERHAQALRRYVCTELVQPQWLAGISLLRPVELAREILTRAGIPSQPGWEEIRRLRIMQTFHSQRLVGALRYFDLDQLCSGRGYAEAFARTIADLEASGLDRHNILSVAERLEGRDEVAAKRLHDVARVWQACDGEERSAHSVAEALALAARALRSDVSLAIALGPCFALLSSSPTTVLLRFLQALPACSIMLQEARPLRSGTQRWRAFLPPATWAELAAPQPTPAAPLAMSELEIVQRFVFELPEVLTDPHRPRSATIDGTVDAEEHASIEEEIEAAATWVADQIAAGVAAEQIALVVPDNEPYAALLSDRLARLAAVVAQPLPVHVAGGLAVATSPAGLRLLAVLRALQYGLEAEATIRIVPWLRHANEGEGEIPQRLTATKAARLIYDAGIVGGTAPDAGGICEWVPRLNRRRDALRQLTRVADESKESHQQARQRQAAQRILKDIDHILPAISDLQGLAVRIQEGAALAELWPSLRAFCKRWLRWPPDPPDFLALLDAGLAASLGDPVSNEIGGTDALQLLVDYMHHARRSGTRFGEPCIFVGTPAHAAGLRFRAVRILGLAEGLIPHSAHDDPLLPDATRLTIEEAAREVMGDFVLPRLGDRVLDEIHDVFRVLQGTTEHLSLSVPRQSAERSEREASGILLEIATALGRREPSDDPQSPAQANGDVPSAARLRSAYFSRGQLVRRQSITARPLSPRSLLSLTAQHEGTSRIVPARWTLPGALSLPRIAEIRAARVALELSAMDGIISAAWGRLPIPGMSRQRPLSATALKTLLECPHRFLLERVLFLKEPQRRPPTDSIEPIIYGSIFHDAANRFLHAHGAALCKHDHSEAHWIALARAQAGECFDEKLPELALRGADTTARERCRLQDQMEYLARYEWRGNSRNFFATEFEFGEPSPIELKLDSGSLYLRGAIDRIDQVSAYALQVRDLKTGRVHDFVEEPVNPTRDLQIGIYVLILEALQLGSEAKVSLAAYVHPSATQEADRKFEGIELDALRRATRAWLTLGHELLSSGSFPRTPDPRDCVYCPFVPACGEGAQARSEDKLRAAPEGTPLARFLSLKRQRGDNA